MMPQTITLPMLPPSLNVYRNEHWKRQREEEKTWKDFIAVKWAEMGRPEFKAVKITLIFSFSDKRSRDLDNYLATGSKLVGDAVKGRFIADDGPEHLTGWEFHFETGDKPGTTVIIEAVEEKSEKWLRPTCSLYETCNAPMCPLDKTSLKGIWYPDEEICKSRTHGNLPWIQAQRKIARCTTREGGYYTLAMLSRNCIIKKGIAGLDPDGADNLQLRKWFDDHPGKREMTDEEKTTLQKRAREARFWEKRVNDRGAGQPPSKGVRTRF